VGGGDARWFEVCLGQMVADVGEDPGDERCRHGVLEQALILRGRDDHGAHQFHGRSSELAGGWIGAELFGAGAPRSRRAPRQVRRRR
jgi:hypothetical protein